MRHEVHQGDKVKIHTEAGLITLRLPRIRGHSATLLLDSANGPIEVEVVSDKRPKRPRRRDHRYRGPMLGDRIGREE